MDIMKYLHCVLIVVSIVFAKRFNTGVHEVQKQSHEEITQSEASLTFNGSSKKESSSDFPSDPFTQEQRLHGAIIVHLMVAFYCFIIIAFVCNDYFLPSVFCICQDLHLSPDITAATFMSTATCAPELFVNMIGTYLTESDLGVGTVVGSAVCNILGVTACAGLAASKDIKLEVWPLLRDSGVYVFVVGILCLILADGIVSWYESLTLVILYFVYFILMFTQKRIKIAAKKVIHFKDSFSSTSSLDANVRAVPSNEVMGTYRSFYFSDYLPYAHTHANAEKNVTSNNCSKDKENNSDDEVQPVCSPPGGFLMNLWWLVSVPVSAILTVSIPDCRRYRKYYPLTFVMCIVWIGICSYINSWMLSVFGYTFDINDAVMGITFLAIGGSIPEASSAVVNAKNGIGSMTVSNALGANTLDILIGLGGPWLIKNLLPSNIGGGPIILETSGLAFNCLCLIIGVVTLNIVTYVNSFKMNRLYGIVCLVCYFIFIAVIILIDLNVIFNFGSGASLST